MDDFIRQTLTISVAQICDNIGWHSITDSSMKIMTDILHHYISELSVTSKKYAEHAYSDEPDLEDVEKAFRQKSISLADLRRYMKSTCSIKFPHNLPLLNIPGKTVLNSIKPGNREIVTRPIHIHEHLPTMYTEPPIEEEESTDADKDENRVEDIKQEPEEIILHKRLREISSVVMTSGGFLSPSREGRLAESKLLPFPEIKKEQPPEPSIILPIVNDTLPSKISTGNKKVKSKLKTVFKKKQSSKKQLLISKTKSTKKPKVLKNIEKALEDAIIEPKPPILEPVTEEIDVVNISEEIQVTEQFIPTSLANKVKIEDVLPKFSFFGPLSHRPAEPIPSTVSEIINTPDITEKPVSPIIKVESENISRKGQKKKKKDKKKEKKEKKRQKDKVKEKEKVKEKKKDKLKIVNKVPKIKLKLGTRIETITKVSPIEKLPEENITIIAEPEPMEIDLDIESKSDISIDVVNNIISPPKVPIQKIKTKIVTKTFQPSLTPVVEPPPAFYYDKDGNQVWICPICTKPDDGSPMIGCDGCDIWYHWVCVGIQCPPDCAVWYCPKCLLKRAQQPRGKRGRPRKTK